MWKLRKVKDYKRKDFDLIKIILILYLFKFLWLYLNCFDIIVGSEVKDIVNLLWFCENVFISFV